jgi:dihydrofolate synthase/folylpolyglutamate synthase
VDRGLTDYRTALDALFARTGTTSKFGLERTLQFLALLGNPHERIKTFHVAGTNGKGSVVATLYALLEAKGLRVGRYMSPHLIDFRERIIVDGQPISEEYISQFLERWGSQAEALGATFFEITSALAFHYFASCQVDVAVIETGLGGRLDSTNVITPLAAGITSIAFDHQEYLGNTEASIAREKAGIMKAGVPAVIGQLSDVARLAVYEVAREKGVATIIEAPRLYPVRDVRITSRGTEFTIVQSGQSRRVTTGLTGTAQGSNTSVALSMLRAAGGQWVASLDEVARVLPDIHLPGRFQRVGSCIFDVAHNVDGMQALVTTLADVNPVRPVVAVVGILGDKDWRGMLDVLSPAVNRMILVDPPSAPKSRAWNAKEAEFFAKSKGIDAVFEADFSGALKRASSAGGTTLITGSFHTVGDALLILGEKTL